MLDGAEAGRFILEQPCRIAFVDRREEPAFKAALGGSGAARLSERVAGVNLNGGKALDLAVYLHGATAP
jgi:hypothetical protein